MLRFLQVIPLLVLALALAAATPALPRAPEIAPVADAPEAPTLKPPPAIANYQRPTFIEINWAPTPTVFCSLAEKRAYLRELDRNLQAAAANVRLAEEARYALNQSVSALGGRSPVLAAARQEAVQLSTLVGFHKGVLETYQGVRARAAALGVSDCARDTYVSEPFDFGEVISPDRTGVLLEGYFTDPILLPENPRLPADYQRPAFAPLDFPPVPDRFCSVAIKLIYLAEVEALLRRINANYEIAFLAARNLDARVQALRAAGREIEADALATEADAYNTLRDHYATVFGYWSQVFENARKISVTNCGKPADAIPPNALDPLPPPPPGDPRLPPLPDGFCSEADRIAFLNGEFAGWLAQAEAEQDAAQTALGKAADDLALASATGMSARSQANLRKKFEAAGRRLADAKERLAAIEALRAQIMQLPLRPCPPPADPAPPAIPDGKPMPVLPDGFCSEADREHYLAWVFSPWLVSAQSDLDRAEKALAEARSNLGFARSLGSGPDAIARLERKIGEATAAVTAARARLEAMKALEERVRQLPLKPCGKPDAAFPPSGFPPLGVPSIPPPRDVAAPAPAPNPFGLPDLPPSFCAEAERLAYLTDVYHPAAQAASQAAVEAYNLLAAMHAAYDAMVAKDPNDIAVAVLAAVIKEQRLEAERLGERARAFIALREIILQIPLRPCPERQDASEPADPGATPLPPSPPAAPVVRPLTDLEAGVIEELNLLRADPAAYANLLAGAVPGARRADVEAAIAALRAASPAPPLESDPRLSGAAIRHADDIGPPGLTTHTGTDGSTLGGRIRDQGLIASLTAEELSYGQSSPRAVVAQLVIDAGVAGAPHRRDLLNPVFRRVGVGCGPHKQYRKVCVITLSGPPVGA